MTLSDSIALISSVSSVNHSSLISKLANDWYGCIFNQNYLIKDTAKLFEEMEVAQKQPQHWFVSKSIDDEFSSFTRKWFLNRSLAIKLPNKPVVNGRKI